ncbi:MAG: chromate transporter [Christensenellaceae bacterium]
MIIWQMFSTFFMIGLFTIGGGYAMIPLITQEVSKWIDLTMLSNFIGISESTPGPFAVNIATFIGFETSGIWGAFFATLGVVLPSFIIILVISKYYEKFKNNFYVASAFVGLRPAVIGLIASAVFMLVEVNLIVRSRLDLWSVVILAILLFVRFKFKKLHPIFIILISAFLGILFFGLFS